MREILFLCQYGGAKSVMAASYFNRMMEQSSMPFVGVAAAAETPYERVPDPVADLLERDGIAVRDFKPREVVAEDTRSAEKIVSMDCDLSAVDLSGSEVERWDDVPRPSVDLDGSASAIRTHVERLVAELRRSQ